MTASNNSILRKIPPYIALLIALLLFIALGTWRYLANPGTLVTATSPIDRSVLIRPHSPSEGRADASVVIVEFFDPACETCRTFYPMVKRLMSEHPGRIRLVMRYAPFHTGSNKVVAVLAAAHRHGKFWPALEALFGNQSHWASNHTAKADLTWKYLDGLGINMEQLAIDLTAPDLKQAIAQDLNDANTLGVAQTPEYFVNGRPLPTFGFEQLLQLVANELAKAR